MLKKITIIITLALVSVFFVNQPAMAGFGISPPYVKTNKPVFAGSHFEQRITLLRSSAEEEMMAVVKVNAPEIASWISIDQGNKFILPKGQLQVPMIVKVDVPKDAAVGEYKGNLNISLSPKGSGQNGTGVSIALGARVEIEINVTDETFIEFKIRKIDIPDLETLATPWKWKIFSWFFYRIKVAMTLENTGNTKVAPSQVKLEVYDKTDRKRLESGIDTGIKKVEPFATSKVFATFPTKLPPDEYFGHISVYFDNEIVQQNKINFRIYPHGKLPGGTKLGIWPWIMMVGLFVVIILFVLLLIKLKIWQYFISLFSLLLWPFVFVVKKIKKTWQTIKIGFWRWVHKKSAKYQNQEVQTNEFDKEKYEEGEEIDYEESEEEYEDEEE